MSDVHLLDADPHKRTATFRWITSGMRKLNRKNKISSPAFQCPPLDSVPPECSFRLVALRGVVKAPQESDDQYGLFVEWMRTGTAPGSVKVAFTFGPPDSSSRLTASVFGQLSTTEVTLGLKEVFTAAQYESLCFPETDALCVDVTLAFDVPVLDTVVKVSKSFGSSLWGGASTTFSVVGSAVSAWGGRVTALLDDAFHFGREEVVNHSASTQACPWDAYPSKWIDRPQRWTFFLTQYLPQNEAVFTVAPRGFTSDEELLLIEAGLSANACTAAAQTFDFDRDVHAALLGPEQRLLRTMRFDLVPGRVSEVDFWRNYFWRIECLKLCATDEQAQILLSILNAPVQGQSVSTVMTHAWKQACENCDTACTLSEEILEEGVSDANAEMLRAVMASVRLAAETLSCLSLADLGTPEDATVVKTAIERSEVVSRKTAEALRQYDADTSHQTEMKAAPPAVATPAVVEAVSLSQPSEEKTDTQPPAPATLSSSPPQPSPTKAEDTISNTQTPPGAAAAPPPSDSAAAASPPRATSEPQSKFALMPWEEEDP